MNTGKYLDCFWIIRVEHIRMTHGRHNPWPEQASSRKENAELDPSRNIIHRVKQAHYYWRYTKLEWADFTIISLRHWHRLTLSLSVSPLHSPPPPSFSCFVSTTRRHSSHAQAAAGGCFAVMMQRRLRRGRAAETPVCLYILTGRC